MSGRSILVSNATELTKALRTVAGGDTILLASGNYGDARVNSLNPKGMVTIKSANPNADAVFESLTVSRSSNFTFEDVDVKHELKAGEPEFALGARVTLSKDITFVGVDFYGSLNGNANDDGNGLSVQDSNRIAVLDSTFREFNIAAAFGKTNDVIFAGNSVSDTREGINLAQVDGALVERNYFTRITPDLTRGDHADAIQVHAGGLFGVSNDLTIRSNVMKLGDNISQGIFIRSEKAKLGLLHNDITVEDNYYEGNTRHGITVGDTTGISVTGNTVRDVGTMGIAPAININNVRGGLVEDNISPMLLPSTSTGVVYRDNIDLWDRKQLSGIADSTIFGTKVGSGDIDFSSLNVRAGSIAAVHGIGFAAVDGIGDLKAGAGAIMAAYLPQFDAPLPHVALI